MRITAVANAPASETQAGRKPEPETKTGGEAKPAPRVRVYKPGQGTWVRFTLLAAAVALWANGCWSLYDWPSSTAPFWGFWWRDLARIGSDTGIVLRWGALLSAAAFLAGAAFAAWATLIHPPWSEFLIETEIELRKVSWPYDRAHSVLSPKQEFVGSAVVVMACMVFLIFFLGFVDWLMQFIFLNWLKIGV